MKKLIHFLVPLLLVILVIASAAKAFSGMLTGDGSKYEMGVFEHQQNAVPCMSILAVR